jgi:hypothetical protein
MADFLITEGGDFVVTESNDFIILEDGNDPSGSPFWNALTGLSGMTGGGQIDAQ